MKTEVIEVSPTQREIKIEIDGETVREVYNKIAKKYAQAASVPGFRKGLAPVDIVKMRYKDEIKNETLRELLPERVSQAIQENNLNPLGEPQLHLENAENIKLNGSEPLSLHVHVEVMPEIPTPDYENLEAVRRVRPVDEAELERLIDQRREQAATLIPVEDRKSQEGDTVIADLEGTFVNDPDNPEPIKAEDLEIKLGDANIEKTFSDNLTGVEEDEEKEFTVEYPPDFGSPGLAGKTVSYKAKIKSVGTTEMPEADDEWASSLEEGYESMADLRRKLREDLEMVSKTEADNRVRDELITKLIEGNEFEVPNTLIDIQARNLLNNLAQDLQQRGMDLNKLDESFVRMAYENMRGQAEKDVRGAMLLEKIAELEGVEVTSEEIGEEIDRIAQYYGVTPEQVRASLSQQGGENNIADRLRSRKAVEALVEKAKVTEGEWIDESQARAAAAAATETESGIEETETENAAAESQSEEKSE
ncbi:MAG: trigger factor [Acidobacteriota bacterium]|nr:trigger factor [Acidobacteriota bacterium]